MQSFTTAKQSFGKSEIKKKTGEEMNNKPFIPRTWLKRIREEKCLTQASVAERCNISQQFFAATEIGEKTPSVKIAKAIGNALGFDWTLFFSDSDHVG